MHDRMLLILKTDEKQGKSFKELTIKIDKIFVDIDSKYLQTVSLEQLTLPVEIKKQGREALCLL